MTSPVLEFKKVSKKFGKKTVLSGLSFSIYPNEIVGIISKSGGGKTTLFRTMLGYYHPSGGTILYRGQNVKKDIKKLRKNVGYTTQENSFYYKLRVIENMRYYAHLYKLPIRGKKLKAHLYKILKTMELLKHAKKRGEQLSGGMKRRLDLAISLIHSPDILLMDEPTTGLDPTLVDQFWKMVHNFKKSGKTIVITSHIFEEIEKNCDRVIILEGGTIKKILGLNEIKEGVYKHFVSKA